MATLGSIATVGGGGSRMAIRALSCAVASGTGWPWKSENATR
jgi:hypothetical protein